MATVICIPIPTLPRKLNVMLPGIGELTYLRDALDEFPRASTYVLRFLNGLSIGIAPIFTIIKILDLVVAIVNCIKAIKDAVMTLSPGPIISCFTKLFQALAALVALLPPFVYIRLIRDIISLLREMIDDLVSIVTLIDAEISRIKATIAQAIAENDPILLGIGNCAKADIQQQVAGIMEVLEAIGKVINIVLNVLDILAALVPGLDKQVAKMRKALDVFDSSTPSAGDWPPLQAIVSALVPVSNGLGVIEAFLSAVLGLPSSVATLTPPNFTNPGS